MSAVLSVSNTVPLPATEFRGIAARKSKPCAVAGTAEGTGDRLDRSTEATPHSRRKTNDCRAQAPHVSGDAADDSAQALSAVVQRVSACPSSESSSARGLKALPDAPRHAGCDRQAIQAGNGNTTLCSLRESLLPCVHDRNGKRSPAQGSSARHRCRQLATCLPTQPAVRSGLAGPLVFHNRTLKLLVKRLSAAATCHAATSSSQRRLLDSVGITHRVKAGSIGIIGTRLPKPPSTFRSNFAVFSRRWKRNSLSRP